MTVFQLRRRKKKGKRGKKYRKNKYIIISGFEPAIKFFHALESHDITDWAMVAASKIGTFHKVCNPIFLTTIPQKETTSSFQTQLTVKYQQSNRGGEWSNATPKPFSGAVMRRVVFQLKRRKKKKGKKTQKVC